MLGRQRTSGLPVDRGWSWVIMIGHFVMTLVMAGYGRALSLFLMEFVAIFQASVTTATLSYAIMTAAFGIGNVVVTHVLLVRFDTRYVIVAGAILGSAAILVCSVAPSITFIIFLHILIGFSHAMMHTSSATLMGPYFHRRMGVANAVANTGHSVSALLIPPLTQFLITSYGTRGALLLVAGMQMQAIVAGFLMRPVEFYTWRKRRCTSQNHPSVENYEEDERLKETFLQKEEDFVVSEENEFSKDATGNKKLVQKESQVQTQGGRKDCDSENEHVDKQNYKNEDYAVHTKKKEGEFSEEMTERDAPLLHNDHTENRLQDSISKPQLSVTKNDHHQEEEEQQQQQQQQQFHGSLKSNDISTQERFVTRTKTDFELQEQMGNHSHHCGSENDADKNVQPLPNLQELCENDETLSELKTSQKREESDHILGNEDKTQASKTQKKNESCKTEDTSSKCSINNSKDDGGIPIQGLQSSESLRRSENSERAPQVTIRVDSVVIPSEEHSANFTASENNAWSAGCLSVMSKVMDFRLLRNWCFLLIMTYFPLGQTNAFLAIFLPALGVERGLSHEKAALLLTIMGAVDLVSRLLMGLLADTGLVRRTRIVASALTGLSAACMFVGWYTSFSKLAVFSVLFGLGGGTNQNMLVVVVVELLGVPHLRTTLGMALLLQSLCLSLSHPLIGALVDWTGSYVVVYYYVGTCLAAAVLVLLMEPLARKLEARRMRRMQEAESSDQ